ncbi:MAG: glycosyltransferase family 1 protein [Chloroflexota bacterium]
MHHIGIDTRLLYYRTGGISTYMRRLVMALENLDYDNRYTVFDSRKASESPAKRFERATLWTPCHHRLERISLSVELARCNLDVLHSPDFIPPLRGAKRHVITVHDLTFLHYPQYLTADSRRYYNGQILAATQRADHILADSEATKNDLIQMLNVPAEKITVHMLGVDERFHLLSSETRAQYQSQLGLPSEYILFVGTFEPRKNILGLLRAYQFLIEQLPDAPKLVLVGKRGWLFEETMAQIAAMRLGERVIWREDISDDLLPAVYNLASFLVMPSFYEGFGFPALEAMACGTVPIVSNRSSLPEVVGDVGVQVDPDDYSALATVMQHALTDNEWRDRMRHAGLERARLFTWDKTASIVREIYEVVCRF